MSKFIKVLAALALLAIICLLYGFFIEPKLLKERRITIPVDSKLNAPMRIVLLSDIHIGGFHVTARRVEKIVERVNALRPDMILIPGDFISGHSSRAEQSSAFNSEVEKGLASLSHLNAPLGKFATIGNHDFWYGVEYVEKSLSRSGFTVLTNKAVNLSNGLCVVGLADHYTQKIDPKAFEDCSEDSVPIALMHSPDSFKILHPKTVLAVAGHTHGGQINIPFIGRRVTATISAQEYAYGQHDIKGITAFVTAGIGTSILPARFRSPPELVLIELGPH